MKNLSREINHILVDRKMDKSELAERLGMTRQNLSRVLSPNKKRQDLMCSALEKIARILEVNIGHFFDDDVSGFNPSGVAQRSTPAPSSNRVQNSVNLNKAQILEQKLATLNAMLREAEGVMKEAEEAAAEHLSTTRP